jgi:hypothetical protein
MATFATADDLQSLTNAIRRRVDELGITLDTLEVLSGITAGYASKCLSDPPMRRATPWTWFLMLQALGLKVALIEDPAAVEKMRRRWLPRKAKKPAHRQVTANTATPAVSAG